MRNYFTYTIIKLVIIPTFFLKTCRNSKLSTWTKITRDVKFHVALYYRSDIGDLLNIRTAKES